MVLLFGRKTHHANLEVTPAVWVPIADPLVLPKLRVSG